MSLSPETMAANSKEATINVPDSRIAEASRLMLDFARRTGLDSDQPPRRYLWTDAFAVCNFLGLADATGEQHYRILALRLIDQVHHVLGRHRSDDTRTGWISGLNPEAGETHPVRGGLRIGKTLSERGPDDPYDERQEWDRDGQYFHYLTKWMHALDQAGQSSGDPRFSAWAQELVLTASNAFTYQAAPGSTPRMYWKMSIDLSRPLISSMGQHDPLSGYITVLQSIAANSALPQSASGPELESVRNRYEKMTAVIDLESNDTLGIGSLLVDAWLLTQLGNLSDPDLAERLLDAALAGLEDIAQSRELQYPAEYRLAFRELGLTIGLHALERLLQAVAQKRITVTRGMHKKLEALNHFVHLRDQIESYWRAADHQSAATWTEHLDINEVMLATSLAPAGFLDITEDWNKSANPDLDNQ